MSRRIKKVQLNRNMTFEAAVSGGYGDIRVDFRASDSVRLSVDTDLGGVLVEKPGQTFTLPWTSIDYIEWMPVEKKQQPPKDAA